MAVATYLQIRQGLGTPHVRPGATGFFAWDGGWYRDIGASGYDETAGLRFFPLLSLVGRLFSPLGAGTVGVVLVLVANACALAYAEGIARLTAFELGDARAAGRAAWFALVNPAAFVLVLAYAEAPAAALAVWFFYGIRRGRWLPAAGLAFLAGLARPTGMLLAVPALVEAARGWASETVRRAVAVLAAPAGCAAYLLWVEVARGDGALPFRIQQEADLRGGVVTGPWPAVREAWLALQERGPWPVALKLVWVPVVLALFLVAARRLPLSYTAYAAAVLFVALGTPHFTSFERYSLAAFPVLMAAASVRTRAVSAALFGLFGVAMAYYATLAFANRFAP